MNMLDIQALKHWADCRETSGEIAMAIFEIADGDDDADRIWESPSDTESAQVIARAWALADDDREKLFWGDRTVRR